MPKKQQLTEPEVHALIVREARYRLGCEEFEPAFTLHRLEPPSNGYGAPTLGLPTPITSARVRANWDVASARNVESWPRECAQAFLEAVQRTRMKYDIAWRASS